MATAAQARRYEPEEIISLRQKLPLGIMALRKLSNLADIVSKAQEPSRRQILSSDYGSTRSSYSYSMREPRNIQWHLRDRESSDSEPLSAPTGAAAQQSENFQRFYRAVVSPTHVRVTAGGRIVPNNRAVAPPIFDWKSEKFIIDPPKSDLQEIKSDPLTSTPLMLLPQVVPRQAHRQDEISKTNSITPSGVLDHTQGIKTSSEQILDVNGSTKLSHATNSEPVKLSHPSQFDNTRPFMYNGHVVYPLPSGFQPPTASLPIPVTMLGNPNFLAPHQLPPQGNIFPLALTASTGQMLHHPLMLPSTSHPALYQVENIPLMAPPYAPTPAMLSVSDLTKHQIEGFRTHLKYLDNQIANNRHQIDVEYMEHQRSEVVSAINNMETMLETQLAQDRASSAPQQYIHKVTAHNNNTNIVTALQKQSQDSVPQDKPLFVKPQSVRVHISSPPVATKPASMAEVMKAAKDLEVVHITQDPTQAIRSEPSSSSKSKLSAAAAMAPAFQPRAKPVSKTASSTTSQATTASYFTPPTSGWIYPTPASSGKDAFLPTIPAAQSMYDSRSQNLGPTADSQQSQTFHGLPSTLSTGSYITPNAVPYLIGTLPVGMTAEDATQKDLVYGRELTEAELRARHLYWGKAPRSVFTGLPKYDGKDFYPPSPIKSIARLVSNPYDAKPVAQQNFSTKEVNLESLLEPSSGPIKRSSPIRIRRGLESILTTPVQPTRGAEAVTTPVCSKADLETCSATPNQIFLENGIIGFQSPSPRPSKYKYEFTSPSHWPVSQAMSTTHPDHKTAFSYAVDDSASTHTDDFSRLFLDYDEHGFMSPATQHPLTENRSRHHSDEEHVTSTNRLRHDQATEIDTGSKGSALGSSFSPGLKTSVAQQPKVATGNNYPERSSNFHGGEFGLSQNMWKHTGPTISAPALSSTTARGYLPPYSGFAAASLSQPAYSTTESAPLIAANFLPENRPLNRDRPRKPVRASPETLGELGYQSYVIAKAAEDAKATAAGWNANTSASGPVTGSDCTGSQPL